MRRLPFLLLFAAAVVLALPGTALAADYYVATDGSDAANSGLQGSPFATVQKAVDAAFASGGGSVFVGPGTFTGRVTLKNSVSLYGAGANETTLTAGGSGSVISINSIGGGETVAGFSITGGLAENGGGIYCYNSSPLICDNTITGNTAHSTSHASFTGGGGVYCYGGAPQLLNNVISENVSTARDAGGGGVLFMNAAAVLRGNTITGNRASSTDAYGYADGGGVRCWAGAVTITGNVVTNNSVNGEMASGGGIEVSGASVTIIGNTLAGNSALGVTGMSRASGGGISMYRVSGTISDNAVTENVAQGESAGGAGIDFQSGWDLYAPTISGNLVIGNVAEGIGGYAWGAGISSSDGSPRLLGNVISGNTAKGEYAEGGGLYCDSFWDDHVSIPVVTNNLISDNVADGRDSMGWGIGQGGGASFVSSRAVVRNNTIAGNRTTGDRSGTGGIYVADYWEKGLPSIVNCILWDNTAGEIEGVGITYSCVDGGAAGDGNVSGSPLFADASAGDYSLLAGSAASDVASASASPADDIRGVERPQGAGFDMGAYEHVPVPAPLPVVADDAYTASEDVALVVSGTGVLANDSVPVDDGPLVAAVVSGTGHGELTLGLTGGFTYTPDAEWSGTDTFTYRATSASGASGTATVTISVEQVSDAPVLAAVGGKSVDERASLVFTATATDADTASGDLAFSLDAGAPAGASIHPTSGSFMWTPTEAQGPGSFDIRVIVSDGALLDTELITVTVAEVASAPVLAAIGDKTVAEGEELTFTASASDEDLPAETLTYSLSLAPSGMTIDSSTGAVSWTPGEADGPETFGVTVMVSDGTLTDSETITVSVAEVATAPVLGAIGDKSVDEGVELSFTASAADADLPAETLTFSLGSGAPAGATIDAATGAFTWTPGEADGPGTFELTVNVSDGALTDSETTSVTVAEVVSAPVLEAIGDKSVDELTALTFTASASDEDLPANTLTFSLGAGAPAGASIDAATGVFTWTPGEADGLASFSMTVVVSDGTLEDSETFTVTVAEVASAPVLAPIGDRRGNELSAITFAVSAGDADLPAETLTFSLASGAPLGASIDPATGVFTWTPTESQGPGTYSVTVVVSDGVLTDSETISITVAEVTPPAAPAPATSPAAPGATSPDQPAAAPGQPAATLADTPEGAAGTGDSSDDNDEAVPVSASEEEPADQGDLPWWLLWALLGVAGLGTGGWLLKRRRTA